MTWLNPSYELVTTGFNKLNIFEVVLRDMRNIRQPVCSYSLPECLNTTIPFLNARSNHLILAGKGDDKLFITHCQMFHANTSSTTPFSTICTTNLNPVNTNNNVNNNVNNNPYSTFSSSMRSSSATMMQGGINSSSSFKNISFRDKTKQLILLQDEPECSYQANEHAKLFRLCGDGHTELISIREANTAIVRTSNCKQDMKEEREGEDYRLSFPSDEIVLYDEELPMLTASEWFEQSMESSLLRSQVSTFTDPHMNSNLIDICRTRSSPPNSPCPSPHASQRDYQIQECKRSPPGSPVIRARGFSSLSQSNLPTGSPPSSPMNRPLGSPLSSPRSHKHFFPSSPSIAPDVSTMYNGMDGDRTRPRNESISKVTSSGALISPSKQSMQSNYGGSGLGTTKGILGRTQELSSTNKSSPALTASPSSQSLMSRSSSGRNQALGIFTRLASSSPPPLPASPPPSLPSSQYSNQLRSPFTSPKPNGLSLMPSPSSPKNKVNGMSTLHSSPSILGRGSSENGIQSASPIRPGLPQLLPRTGQQQQQRNESELSSNRDNITQGMELQVEMRKLKDEIIPHLTTTIQEQAKQLKEQDEKIKALERQIQVRRENRLDNE